jgi:hypothetical protein
MDTIKDFLSKFTKHDLPTGVAVLIGIVLLVLVLKTGRNFVKLTIFLIAVALFVGAYFWHHHR